MRREEGFTLIELLVTLVIAGLLLGGVYSMMIRQQASYQTQDQVVEVQQNLRSTFILFRYDLRMTGFGLVGGTAPISTHLNNQSGLNGTDQIILGFNPAANSVVKATDMTDPLPDILSYGLFGAPIPVVSVAGFPTPTTPPYLVDVIDMTTGILITDAHVTAVTEGDPPTLTLACPVLPCLAETVAAGSYIGLHQQTITYRVNLDPPVDTDDECQHPPCLERVDGDGNASVLAEGVEDFQVAYGFDGINQGVVPPVLDGIIKDTGAAADDDEWVYNAAGDNWPSDTSGLRAIRVTLLLRTTNRDPGFTGGTTGVLEDHAWTSPLDGYRRRVIQFMENVRNLSL